MRRLTAFGVMGFLFFLTVAVQAAPVEELVTQLKDKDNDTRRAAAKALGDAGMDAREAVPALVAALKDDDAYVRRFSALALGNIGAEPKTVVPALVKLLNNPTEKKEVQEGAAIALGKLGPGGAAALADVVKDKGRDTIVRRRAVEALGAIGPDARAALPTLTDAIKMTAGGKKGGGSDDIRAEVADALGKIASAKDDTVLAALSGLAEDKALKKDKGLRQSIQQAITSIKQRKE